MEDVLTSGDLAEGYDDLGTCMLVDPTEANKVTSKYAYLLVEDSDLCCSLIQINNGSYDLDLIMPPPTEGIMFLGCPSVRPSVRPSVTQVR